MSSTHPKRMLGPDRGNLFYFADEETHTAIMAYLDRLDTVYGPAETNGLLHELIVQKRIRGGLNLLRAIYNRFQHRAPDEAILIVDPPGPPTKAGLDILADLEELFAPPPPPPPPPKPTARQSVIAACCRRGLSDEQIAQVLERFEADGTLGELAAI